MKIKSFGKKSFIINNLIRKFLNSPDENFTFIYFLLISVAFLTKIVGGSAWITVFFLFSATVLFCLKLHDAIAAFLLMTIYSLQFYVPNKYYIVEVFSPHELLNGVGSYLLSYGINIKNIFLAITILMIVRLSTLTKIINTSKKSTYLIPVIISGLTFFTISLYSLLRFSPFPQLSTVWLIHYMQMFLVGFSILFISKSNKIKLIAPVILSSIFLESGISIMQFIKQGWAGLPIESAKFSSVYYGASDAVSSVFRVAGTFGQSNQFGMVMLIMLILIIPITFQGKKPIYIFGSFLCVIMMLLTESRAVWISFLGVSLISIKFYNLEIQNFIKSIGVRRLAISICLVLISTSIVVIPRIISSVNAFTDAGGATLRSEMLKEANLAIQQNPWVGYGIGTNEYVLHKLFPLGYVNWFPAPVHIAYIQLILESGILGLFSFLFPFVYIIRGMFNNYFYKNRKKIVNKNYIFVAFSGIVGFGLYYLFQPHEGIRDFYYLGVILGYGLISLQSNTIKSK